MSPPPLSSSPPLPPSSAVTAPGPAGFPDSSSSVQAKLWDHAWLEGSPEGHPLARSIFACCRAGTAPATTVMLTEAGESEARIMTLKNARSREGRAAPAADGTSTPARVSGSSDVIPVSGRAAGAGMVTWYVATILKDARTAAVAAASTPQRVEAACPSEEDMVRGEAGKPSAGCSSTGLSGDQPSAPTAVRRKQEPSQPWRRKGKNESRRWGGGGGYFALVI